MDISLLFDPPDIKVQTILIIEPLAPLSMVSDLPGSFYKSEIKPSKIKLCGLLENTLGWHFTVEDRKSIKKKLTKVRQNANGEFEIDATHSNVEYFPLLAHLFEIGVIMHEAPLYYSDLWKLQLFRWDGYSHPNGTMNLSYELLGEKNQLRDNDGKISNEQTTKLFEKNRKLFPAYYTSPRQREFIVVKGSYKIQLKLTQKLYILLCETLENNNLGYLGNSEGWVNIKFVDNDSITTFL